MEVSNVPIWPIYHLARRVEGKKAAFVASPPSAHYITGGTVCTLEKGGGVVVLVGKRVGSVPAAGWITITR